MFRISFYYNLIFVAIFLTLIYSPLAVTSSFNCKKSSTEVEYKICSNPKLRKADKQMSKVYFRLLEKLPKAESEILQQDQMDWLKERNYELLNCIEPNCKLHFYEIRITQLEAPIEQASFNCDTTTSEIEKMICGNRLLEHADGRMAKLYTLQKDKLLQQDQLGWLKLRDNELSQAYCGISCVWQLYEDRIEFLVRYPYILAPYNQ